MDCRPYTPSDFPAIEGWFKSRNMTPVPPELLPPVGYIVPDVGCAFLYQTDGRMAFVENFITNPKANHEERVNAGSVLLQTLVKHAKEAGHQMVYALTQHPMIEARCLEEAFKCLGAYKMYFKEVR